MTRQEKKFFWLVACLIIFISFSPFLIAFFTQATSSFYYTGVNYIAGFDKTVYFSFMEQARDGKWLFKNLYTSEPQTAKLFSPLWLILGKIAFLTHLSNPVIFHLARIFFAFIFLYLIYQFLKNFFPKEIERRIIFLIISFASGLGIWQFIVYLYTKGISLELVYEKVGTDMWISESNTFLTIIHSPLFILSQIIILGIFWLFLIKIDKFTLKNNLLLFFLTLFLGVFHPYDIIIICSVLGVFIPIYFILKKRIIWYTVINFFSIILASGIAVFYFLFVLNKEPAFHGWFTQNVIISPRFFNYIIGYGLIFLFFLIGILPLLKKKRNYYFLFLLIWALVQLSLLYSPFQFQTKLSNGLHLPLTIIAGLGFFWIIQKLKDKKIGIFISKNIIIRIFLIQIIFLLLMAGNFFIIFFEYSLTFSRELPIYFNQDEYQAIEWLKDNVGENEIMLAHEVTGNLLPAVTGRIVYFGHGHQTLNSDEKLTWLRWFFKTNGSDQVKKNWLNKENIDYIYFSRLEDKMGDYQPATKDYLEIVYQNQGVSIFKVK